MRSELSCRERADAEDWVEDQDACSENYAAYRWWLWAVMRNLEEQYYLWKSGVLGFELLNARVETLSVVFSEGGVQREWWPEYSRSMTPEFSEWLSQKLLANADWKYFRNDR